MANPISYYVPIKGKVDLYPTLEEALNAMPTHHLNDIISIPTYTTSITKYIKSRFFKLFPYRGDFDFNLFSHILSSKDIQTLKVAATLNVYVAHKVYTNGCSVFVILLKNKYISKIYKSSYSKRGAYLKHAILFKLHQFLDDKFYYYNLITSIDVSDNNEPIVFKSQSYINYCVGKDFIPKEDDFYIKVALAYITDNNLLINADVIQGDE